MGNEEITKVNWDKDKQLSAHHTVSPTE